MPNLSPGIQVAWQFAAQEAAYAKREYIEPEHIFMGLCKAGDLLRPDYLEKLGVPPEKIDQFLEQIGAGSAQFDELQSEIDTFNQVFAVFGLNQTEMRRRLRETIGQGNYEHTERVIHRSPECKQLFERGTEIAKLHNYPTLQAIHLLLAIVENPSPSIAQLFSEFGIEVENFCDEVDRRVKGEGETEAGEKAKADSPSAVKARKEPGAKNKQASKQKAPKPKTYFLDRFGRDITQEAKEEKLTPVIGRRDELLQVIRTLTRKTKNNPLLIGEAGVGKTAIVEGLAQRIVSGNLTPSLRDKRIVELSLGTLVAGTKYRGEFEERLTQIIKEAKTHPEIILFIDEIHTVVSAGAAEGALDAANILKPALARGDVRCIGATTISEYRKYIEKDSALERRFQPLLVKEPSLEASLKILQELKERYGKHHQVNIDPLALVAAVELSSRYIPDRRLPDKALDLLDEACTRVKVTSLSFHGKPDEVPDIYGEVTEEVVAKVVEEWTGIPVQRILGEAEKQRLLRMEEIIKEKVIGQDEAVRKVAQSIRMARAGLKDPRHPIGVFLFLGPTGVGKTELAKALADFLFGPEDKMTRLDMSEYMEKHTVSKLIGAPPGYVGYEEEGQLTGKLRTMPYSVVLLDEIEKAHPEVLDIFLQLFDEGRLTDSKGRTVDGKNAIFVMTSNVALAEREQPIGFRVEGSEALQKVLVKQGFRPEFLNRIDEIIVFRSLEEEDIKKIAELRLEELKQRLHDNQGLVLEVDSSALALICQEGYDEKNGARHLTRTIERLIAKPLSKEILSGKHKAGDGVIATTEKERIVFMNIGAETIPEGHGE